MSRLAVIVAHPDDETYPFAGTIRAWVDRGGEASVLTLTRGEAGWDVEGLGRSGEDLAGVRERELAASARELGATATSMRFADGGLRASDEVVDAVRGWLEARRPEVVLTLGEDGAYGHVDHLACTEAVTRAASGAVLHAAFAPGIFAEAHRAMARLAPRLLGVSDPRRLGTDRADYALDVTPWREAKLAAVAAHRSQLKGGDPRSFLYPSFIDAVLGRERYVHAAGPIPDHPFWRDARCESST